MVRDYEWVELEVVPRELYNEVCRVCWPQGGPEEDDVEDVSDSSGSSGA